MAAHRDRVAQDKIQQLAALEHHAAIEHDRISHLGDVEHVAAQECHAAHERDRCAQLCEGEHVAACYTMQPKSVLELLNWARQSIWLPVNVMLHLSTIELRN